MTDARTLTEADLFRSFWDDGLLDLLCGLALLFMGAAWMTKVGPFAPLLAPLWIVLWVPLRRRFVEPHAGFVRFSVARREKNARGLTWTLGLGIGALALFAATAYVLQGQRGLASGPVPEALAPGIPAVLVAVGIALAGLLTGARRFLLFGIGLLAAAAVTVLVGGSPAAPLVAGGLVVAVTGAVLLARFVREADRFEEHA